MHINDLNIRNRVLIVAISTVLVLSATIAQATTIAFTDLSSTDQSYGGVVRDTVTGTYYRSNGYSAASGGLNVVGFGTQAAFEANSGGLGIPTPAAALGTYFAASGGGLYGHTGTFNEASVGKWDIATGALLASVNLPQFNGTNGGGYNWGGFSSMNVLQDASGMYLFSGNAAGGKPYRLARLAQDLTVSNEVTFSAPGAGWGFMAGGTYFGGASYNNNSGIDYSVDGATGTESTSSVLFTGLVGSYITNVDYIANTDTLYVWDSGRLYKATGVADALGVGGTAVPEPPSWALIVSGFVLAAAALRRRRSAVAA